MTCKRAMQRLRKLRSNSSSKQLPTLVPKQLSVALLFGEMASHFWERYKPCLCKDSRIVPGAAATEIKLARRLKEFSLKETGLDQYAIAKFQESFEMIPRTFAENAGLNATDIISSLYERHGSRSAKVGTDLD
ncbi:hypothetical protein MLD38_018023 [Melastoma candidum]|uniref:Uncharacterized protein n=1 Tax=Melastoma candidum TaxID=119954 RepID=A0ACB9QSG2_9MYRT|nr:hypothetical protein MLD38_018023 [Melastoma candidum]